MEKINKAKAHCLEKQYQENKQASSKTDEGKRITTHINNIMYKRSMQNFILKH